jgi:hypothetical protein
MDNSLDRRSALAIGLAAASAAVVKPAVAQTTDSKTRARGPVSSCVLMARVTHL